MAERKHLTRAQAQAAIVRAPVPEWARGKAPSNRKERRAERQRVTIEGFRHLFARACSFGKASETIIVMRWKKHAVEVTLQDEGWLVRVYMSNKHVSHQAVVTDEQLDRLLEKVAPSLLDRFTYEEEEEDDDDDDW